MVDDGYKKLEQYVAERLNQGVTPETIKRELVMRGINPAAVDYAFKRVETNNRIQRKDFMRSGKTIGILVLIAALAVLGFYFYNSFLAPVTVGTVLFKSGFESREFNSTPIIATQSSSYSSRDYNNVPPRWVITFNDSGIFQWTNAAIYHGGSKSINMTNGSISAAVRINIEKLDTKNLLLRVWVQSNDLSEDFAFVEVGHTDQENKFVPLKRSKKIVGTVAWRKVQLPFEVPDNEKSIVIRLRLLERDKAPELYEKLENFLPSNATKIKEKLPLKTVWFDEVQLLAIKK